MALGGSINDTEVNGKWASRADLAPRTRRTAEREAQRILIISKKKMNELIYANPIPRGADGKPQWHRTGYLYRSERVEIKQEKGDISIYLVNDAAYALARDQAGFPGHRRTRFPAHWREEARDELHQTHFLWWTTLIGELILGLGAIAGASLVQGLLDQYLAGLDLSGDLDLPAAFAATASADEESV